MLFLFVPSDLAYSVVIWTVTCLPRSWLFCRSFNFSSASLCRCRKLLFPLTAVYSSNRECVLCACVCVWFIKTACAGNNISFHFVCHVCAQFLNMRRICTKWGISRKSDIFSSLHRSIDRSLNFKKLQTVRQYDNYN